MENITVCERLVVLSIVPQHGCAAWAYGCLFMQGYTLCTSDHVSEHGSYQGSFNTWEAYVYWELKV